MTADRVNILNIFLMCAACAAAFVLPFELFLVAYAILGPLHYLTQISWLHTRGYFTTGKRDYLFLLGLFVCLMLVKYLFIGTYGLDAKSWAATAVIVAFASALGMALATRIAVKAALVVVAFLAAQWVADHDATHILILTFVPTIIHVYCFTAAFMLYGALKGRSLSGIAALVVFFGCSASFVLYRPDGGREVGEYVRATYGLVSDLNVNMADWLGLSPLDGDAVFASSPGVALMRFIAFAYTYHYLNWFSKTSVIQWHKIPAWWTVVNVVLWIGSVALYAWDYRTGLLVLFSLSWLHVILEFPLDQRTFVGIGRELGLISRQARSLSPARSSQSSAGTTS